MHLLNYITYFTGKIIVTSLPPISTIGLTKDNIADLMNHTYDVMRAQFLLTSAEVQSERLNQEHSSKSRSKKHLNHHLLTTHT